MGHWAMSLLDKLRNQSIVPADMTSLPTILLGISIRFQRLLLLLPA